MSKCMIHDIEEEVTYIVACPYCEDDSRITIDDFEQDLVNGGTDTEYYCDECGSTFYESELDLEDLEKVKYLATKTEE